VGRVLVTPPTEEPLELAEAKLHLRIEESQTAEDGLVDALIRAARQYVEEYTGRALVKQTWKLTLDRFPTDCGRDMPIRVPLPPLRSVGSIKYIDSSGVQQTLASSEYLVDSVSEPARIAPAYEKTWPIARQQMNAVEVQFECGATTGAEAPPSLKAAMKLLIGHWYANKEAVTDVSVAPLPMAVESLLSQHRVIHAA
jgi:uncharacterized phiE125 gp8 family phage protein